MNIWQTLGIEKTNDKKLIKQAYSERLKTTDQTTDIEGFQELHGAYKKALKIASDDVSQNTMSDVSESISQADDEIKAPSESSYESITILSHDKNLPYEIFPLQEVEETNPVRGDMEAAFDSLQRQLHSDYGSPAIKSYEVCQSLGHQLGLNDYEIQDHICRLLWEEEFEIFPILFVQYALSHFDLLNDAKTAPEYEQVIVYWYWAMRVYQDWLNLVEELDDSSIVDALSHAKTKSLIKELLADPENWVYARSLIIALEAQPEVVGLFFPVKQYDMAKVIVKGKPPLKMKPQAWFFGWSILFVVLPFGRRLLNSMGLIGIPVLLFATGFLYYSRWLYYACANLIRFGNKTEDQQDSLSFKFLFNIRFRISMAGISGGLILSTYFYELEKLNVMSVLAMVCLILGLHPPIAFGFLWLAVMSLFFNARLLDKLLPQNEALFSYLIPMVFALFPIVALIMFLFSFLATKLNITWRPNDFILGIGLAVTSSLILKGFLSLIVGTLF
ncbi:MAG: hypothetical protein HRU19_21000 [Pseudobacteriovorax sp.]|nr:hypothetical protein [Pseudobacteriovorax sp.]